MNKFGVFDEIEINRIKPRGWLRNWLVCQKEGLTGHLEAAGYPFGEVGWDTAFAKMGYQTDVADEWWPYEQTGYWVDGMVRCGLLLDDKFLLDRRGRVLTMYWHIRIRMDISDRNISKKVMAAR